MDIRSLPGVEEVFTYVEGGTNTFMPDTKMFNYQEKLVCCHWWNNETPTSLTAIGSSTVTLTEDFGTKVFGRLCMLTGDFNRTCG